MKEKVIKVGLLGSGTVGKGVQDILFQEGDSLAKKLGYRLDIERIYTRNPEKRHWYSRFPEKFTTDPNQVINHPEISIVVEVLGVEDHEKDLPVQRDYIISALRGGKSVVTSNKALLARFGKEIHDAALKNNKQVRFEASVAGGIPIIRSLGEGLVSDSITRLYGILNGTCNYILSGIHNQGKTFQETLRKAQELGYAETNPEADIKGYDTRDKVIVLLQLIYGLFVKKEDVATEGIDLLEKVDFDYARGKLHTNIKLLGSIKRSGQEVTARVSPIMIKEDHVLSRVDGPLNAVLVESQHCETLCFVGKGAGAGPTANSVVSDIISIASGYHFSPRLEGLRFNKHLDENTQDKYYLRFVVRDRPGIVGDILSSLKQNKANVDEVLQLKHSPEEKGYFKEKLGLKCSVEKILPFIITLEPCKETAVRKAMEGIKRQDFLLMEPVVIKMLLDIPDVTGQ